MSARLLVLVAACATATPAAAQSAADRPVRRLEVDVGGGLTGGGGLGGGDANLRANAQAREAFRLFAADSEFARAPAVHARAAFAFTRRFTVEGGVTWSRPEIRTSITADAEGAAPVTSVERVDQYVFDASVVMMLDAFRLGTRLVPFVAGGGGYLRQLHEGQTVIEHGQVYHAGGGVKYWLLARPGGFLRSAGLRGDVRAQVARGGITFEDRPRPHVAISGSLFFGF
ncbi:MAG: hypothetical protein HYY76_03450 [Acidobacteria bacterium]|nr:hypothetical protein [Acidobacteriota bacterium]